MFDFIGKGKEIIDWLKKNLGRFWLFIVIAIGLPLFDRSIFGVYLTLCMIAVIIFATNIMRKELFPYIDLEKLIDKTDDNPLASAIVVASIVYLIAVIIQSCVVSLK